MSLLNHNRYSLVLLALFMSMSLFLNLPEVSGEEVRPELSESQQQQTEEIAPGVAVEEVAQEEVAREEAIPEEIAPEVTTQMFQIKYMDVEEAKEEIKELLSPDEKIGASVEVFTILRAGEEVDFLVVRDTPQNIDKIGWVLEELEKEFTPLMVDLEFIDVALSQILTTIAHTTDLNIIGGEELSQKITTRLKDVPIEDVFDIVLESTDYAYIRDGKVLQIIPKSEMPLLTEVFELKYVFAEQIKKAASHLVSNEGRVKTFSKFTEEEYSNVLIVTDTPKNLKIIRNLIQSLDKKVGQVMIEAKFCEVTLDKDNKLGIDWVLQASLTGASTKTRFPLPMVGAKGLDRPATLTQESATMTMGAISFADFSATLWALDTDTKIDIISSPRIATRDGEEAKIVIGDRIPIPTYERHRETAGLVITGYEDEEVGVVLKVTPIINPDNTVTLKLNPEVSSITDWVGPNDERPRIATSEVSTVFTVESGQTAVIGGLIKQTLTDTLRKVPGLGNIPLLGRLFRYKYDGEDRKELLIFITPHILGGSEKVWEEAELFEDYTEYPDYTDYSDYSDYTDYTDYSDYTE